MGFGSKQDFGPPTIFLGLLLYPWMWGTFFGGIQHPPGDDCSAAICNFGVLTGEDEHISFYSAILRGKTLLNSLVIIVFGEKFPKIIKLRCNKHLGFPSDSAVKNLPAMQDTWVQSLDQENPLEEGMATHSSILAWRIPQTEEPGGLESIGSQRVGHN